MDWNFVIFSALKILGVFSVLMFIVAYAVWVERKVAAAVQDRIGPTRFGIFGLLQPAADAIKAYEPFQQTINDFSTTWTEKSADLTALKDGLAAGKLEGDVAAKTAELNSLVTTATENLANWQSSYGAIKGGVDSALNNLNQVIAGFTAGK